MRLTKNKYKKMNRNDFITEIRKLIDSGEMVSIEGYMYSQRISRSCAVIKLSDKTAWTNIEIDSRVYYIKK